MIRRFVAVIILAALLCLSATAMAAEAPEEASVADSAREVITITNNNVNTNININGQPWYIGAPMTAGYLASGLYAPYGALYVVNPQGNRVPPYDPVSTGDSVLWTDGYGNDRSTELVVKGDVLGSGTLSIAQLVRMAKALNGSWPLEGVYLIAADLNGSGGLDIADLVLEAQLLW